MKPLTLSEFIRRERKDPRFEQSYSAYGIAFSIVKPVMKRLSKTEFWYLIDEIHDALVARNKPDSPAGKEGKE